MRIFLDQVGCRLNYAEMETLAGQLRAAGHATVDSPQAAQVIVFNSCAVTAAAGRKSRQRVHQLHRANPQARLAVTGCWVTLQPDRAAALDGVALVAANAQKDLLHTLLEPWSAELDDPDDAARLQPDGLPFSFPALSAREPAQDGVRPQRTRAFIKVQDGCNNRCTFCVVTLARGESRSRAEGEIVAEIQQAVAEGVSEVVLTGVHLGSYGRDLAGVQPVDLKTLTASILRETGIARLRLSSLEPWELADGFFDLWAMWPQRLCPHLHLPLQAGTDRQLRRMARRCTVESYRRLVTEARANIPDLVLTTDLIVGFPGESEADFEQGLAFVEEMRFAHAHIFPFSARGGTAAASFDGQLSKAVKKQRSQRMHQLVEETARRERKRFVGTVRPVLWEADNGELTDEVGRVWTGFTDNYLRVRTVAPPDAELHKTISPVRLEGIHGDTLLGTIVGQPVAELRTQL